MLQALFAFVVLLTGVAWWFVQPYSSVAVIRMPSDVQAERVAPQVVRVLTSERFLNALSSECDSPSRRARVRRTSKTDVEIAFRCDSAEGATHGVDAILRRAFELDVMENGMVVDRPLAPVEVDTNLLNQAPEPGGDKTRNGAPTVGRMGGSAGGRPLEFEVVQKPTEPTRRLFY